MAILRPTHTCFDDAMEYLEELAKAGTPVPELLQYVLVHAICIAPDGHPFAHAWVELDGQVLQTGILDDQRVLYAMARVDFEQRLPVREETRYTLPEVLKENERTGHYGPWVEAYKAYVNDGPDPEFWQVTP